MNRNSLLSLGLAVLVGTSCAPSEEPGPATGPVLPFIEDDYAAALAEAKRREVPIFVDVWAPW